MKRIILPILIVFGLIAGVQQASAVAPANQYFLRTWERTDKPVADLAVSRTWMWGPDAFTGLLQEAYEESPGGLREVQYFDKSRMEITHPDGNADSIWYVTNGLLVVELITGEMQVGDDEFEDWEPAEVNVAGDPGDPSAPTYASFSDVLEEPARELGTMIDERIDRDGDISSGNQFARWNVLAAELDTVTWHTIAAPFWDFMNSSGLIYENGQLANGMLFENPYFATGRPISEAYWSVVLVGGEEKDVLIQCFERRCLTFTPTNSEGWQIEAGNVGQHYYAWRYAEPESGVLNIGIGGREIWPGTTSGDVTTGLSFIGVTTGDVAGSFQASMNYTPPNPGPNVVNTLLGGTWSISSDDGNLSGTISGGMAIWDDTTSNAAVTGQFVVVDGTGRFEDASGTGEFTGVLSHLVFPPTLIGDLVLTLD